MALTDSDAREGYNQRIARRPEGTNGKQAGSNKWWSDKQKLELVQTYLVMGNLAQAARMLKIPDPTARVWRASQWWKDIEGELKLQDELQLTQRMKSIIGKSLDVVEDRMEHGDYVYDQKSGKMRRKPVSARDANKIAHDSMDRQRLIESKQVSLETKEATADKLLKLAQKFAELAGAVQKEEPIELEVVQVDGLSGEVYGVPDEEEFGDMAEEAPADDGFNVMRGADGQ